MALNMISIQQFFLISITVLSLSIGQVLFKVASNKLELNSSGLVRSLLNPTLAIALLVYAIATLMWLLVLKQTPLRIAYPFAALAFVFVPFLAHYLLHEPMPWTTMAGALVICLGVWISSLR
jgi:drug/metabolite transporter (DMT)-like permease